MAKRDNTFLLVAAALGFVAWQLFKPKAAAGPATHQDGTAGGGIVGSPHQVVYVAPGVPFDLGAMIGV